MYFSHEIIFFDYIQPQAVAPHPYKHIAYTLWSSSGQAMIKQWAIRGRFEVFSYPTTPYNIYKYILSCDFQILYLRISKKSCNFALKLSILHFGGILAAGDYTFCISVAYLPPEKKWR